MQWFSPECEERWRTLSLKVSGRDVAAEVCCYGVGLSIVQLSVGLFVPAKTLPRDR